MGDVLALNVHTAALLIRQQPGQILGRAAPIRKTIKFSPAILHQPHALINLRLNVNFIRLRSTRYGFGRIYVKRVTRPGAGYLSKYLTKQGRTGWLKHKRLWTTFGKFDKARVKDIIVDSPFTRAIKFCQEELQRPRLPFWFVSALQFFPTSDPVRLKLACRAAQGGAYYADIIRILMMHMSRGQASKGNRAPVQ